MANDKTVEKTEEKAVEKKANKKAEEKPFDLAAYYMEKVEIPPLFFDQDKYSAPVFVGYNGKQYLIPRGKAGIKVPRGVAEILQQSEYQNQIAVEFQKKNEGVKNQGEFN